MKRYWSTWRTHVLDALRETYRDVETSELEAALSTTTPPDREKGDIAFPIFPFAKLLRDNPARIAARLAESGAIAGAATTLGGRVEANGPYLNVFLGRADSAAEVVSTALAQGADYGDGSAQSGTRAMVEFSCPNTNKPLHLGHLRNDALGESVSRILAAAGATVHKVNLINDRGIHICKSMLAYQKFGAGETPATSGRKSDHFVGDYYVRYAQWEKDDPTAEEQARELLRKWEAGDQATHELWLQMNRWAIDGIERTYDRTGISFDDTYYESRTYTLGRDEVMRGLNEGVFTRDEKGTVWANLTDIGLDRKVVLRGDGTSLYLTQDIGTAIQRYRDWPFDRLVYVVASEQRYHFQVLFEVLKRLGKQWAGALHHLAYGMVNLPDGRMKSREGTVVDADDLLDHLVSLVTEEIRSRGRESDVGDVATTAEQVAIGALHYYLLQISPAKDMVFDPEESLSFNGNTGPYLQYVGARISSMLRKQPAPDRYEPIEPETDVEWELVHHIAAYPDAVADAAASLSPAIVAGHLYDTAKVFSRFYHDHPIAVASDPIVRSQRLGLAAAVMHVMRHGLRLLNIPFVEAM